MIDRELINTLAAQWRDLKELERETAVQRRMYEKTLVELLAINTSKKGTTNEETSDFKLSCSVRMDQKVDAKMLQEIADENDIGNGIISNLFRWKPELNVRNWDAAHDELKKLFGPCITTKPSTPSFKIELKEKEEKSDN